jgi:hypothetical protein
MHLKINDLIVNTQKARNVWEENTYFDGRNHISSATGSQWDHQMLYESSRGNFYIVSESDYQGSPTTAEFVDEKQAVMWLLQNEIDPPERLASVVAEVEE